jgi:hypothetical protein
MTNVRMVSDPEHESSDGGTVTYRVMLDDRWIGWVGDRREWRGSRYGGRQWWACWREDGDTAARWNSFSNSDDYPTRKAALAALLDRKAR